MNKRERPTVTREIEEGPRQLLLRLFDTAVASAHPDNCLASALPVPWRGKTLILGAGKAAAAMARVFERNFDGVLSGTVVVPDAHLTDCTSVEVLVASHPVPDARSVVAGRTMLGLAQGAGAGDRVVCLLSGGGSSLLCVPAPGLTLEDKQAMNRDLLRAGADIAEINCVRKHLSAIKGGRLALACAPADLRTFAISDVPGDDPGLIASGPVVGDASSREDALAVLEKYELLGHQAAVRCLQDPGSESPWPDDPRLPRNEFSIVASGRTALEAAARAATDWGIRCHSLDSEVYCDASALAAAHADEVRAILASSPRPDVPLLLLSGGETTVKLSGPGRGGRNTHYLLALAAALDGLPGVFALAGDTDGVDGCSQAAGAIYEPPQAVRWQALGLDPQAMLAAADSGNFFAALGALFGTGPTLTNVNDFRAILMQPAAWEVKRSAGCRMPV